MFRTIVKAPSTDFRINHEDSILSLGSCFAQNMGQRMAKLKFKLINNPFGIIYNPDSLCQSLSYLSSRKQFEANELFFHQDCWHSWAHHGSFSHPQAEIALQQINQTIQATPPRIQRLIITLGSAYAYRHRDTGKIVANCHKMPAATFDKIRLSAKEIAESLLQQLTALQGKNPDLKTILTVSPIRHLKDGILENHRSKAILLLAVEQVIKSHSDAYYFPSYEIMMDDLRDYRFYEADLLHPNQQAQDYIWEQFSNTFFEANTKTTIKEIQQFNRSLAHRPLHPDSNAHKAFLQKQYQTANQLKEKYPALNFKNDLERLALLLSK